MATSTDLVVVGAGAGGMAAAIAAAQRGVHVVICEATDQVGGTTATSAGTLWVPGNRHGVAAGHGDNRVRAGEYLDALLGARDPRGLRAAYLAHAADTLAEIEARTRLRFVDAGIHPDYLQAPGAARAGRALSPVEFDGRELGSDDFGRVRPPIREFMVLGGMMANKADVRALFDRWRTRAGFVRSARLLLRYARDRLRHHRGTRLVLGNALVARLLASMRDAGVEIRFDHRLVQLAKMDGRVVGAVFEHRGRRETLTARHGVVLATGGIGHDTSLRKAMSPQAAHGRSLACNSVRGEGIAAARAAGAAFERHSCDYFWQPVSEVPRGDGTTGLLPHLYLDRAKPGLIAVDGGGRRFVDEGASYHHFCEALRAAAGSQASAWLVCDAEFLRRYGLGVIPPGRRRRPRHEASGYLISAPTLDALAGRLGLDGATLSTTVSRHNEAARIGSDADFHKGDSPLGRFNGDAEHRPNPCLGPIATPPFHALRVWAADAGSSSGLVTDVDGAVLDADDRVIPGLYACGNDMASMMRGAYPGPGTTLGPALVFGWRCGVRASTAPSAPAKPVKEAA